MTFEVEKLSPTVVFCADQLVDAINDDVTIPTQCEDLTVEDGVNLTIFFEGSGPLSGAEDAALDALIAAFVCSGNGDGINEGAGIVLQHNRRSFINDIERINFEGSVAAVSDNDAQELDGGILDDSRGNVLVGSLRVKNPNLYVIPNNSPVYTLGFCIPCNRLVVDLADASDVNKMPAIGLTQLGEMWAAMPVVGVTVGGNGVGAFVVSGDYTSRFTPDRAFSISLSTANDNDYRVSSSSYASGPDETTILTQGGVVDGTVDGRVSDVGFVAITGETRNCNTAAASVNDPVYVAPGGGISLTKPTGEDTLIQVIARITHVDATEGRVIVTGTGRVNDTPNLPEDYVFVGDETGRPIVKPLSEATEDLVALDDLKDVDLTLPPSVGDLLTYVGGPNDLWTNLPPDQIAEVVTKAFKTITCDGATSTVADQAEDTLTLVGGTALTTTASGDPNNTITLNVVPGDIDFDDLGDVDTTGVTTGQGVKWNGSTWIPTDLAAGAGNNITNCLSGKIAARCGTTKIPFDNTTPLITEGSQIWSQAVTPTSGTSKFIVTTSFTLDTYNSELIVLAIFRDSICIGSTVVELQLQGGSDDDDDDNGVVEGTMIIPVSFTVEDDSTGSAVTYSARVGRGTYCGAWYVNRTKDRSSPLGGTMPDSAYTIMECEP